MIPSFSVVDSSSSHLSQVFLQCVFARSRLQLPNSLIFKHESAESSSLHPFSKRIIYELCNAKVGREFQFIPGYLQFFLIFTCVTKATRLLAMLKHEIFIFIGIAIVYPTSTIVISVLTTIFAFYKTKTEYLFLIKFQHSLN